MKAVQGSRMVPGRWTPRILFSLNNRPYRHGQLRRHLGRVSQRMLTRPGDQEADAAGDSRATVYVRSSDIEIFSNGSRNRTR
jgi:hypothetical protein